MCKSHYFFYSVNCLTTIKVEMKNKVHKLEVSELDLIVGQIAFLVDQASLTHVMEGIGEPKARSIYMYNVYVDLR